MKRLGQRLPGLMLLISAVVSMPANSAPAADFPHAPISLLDGSGEAEFHILGDRAVVTLRSADGTVKPLRIIDDVDDALSVLADRRLSFAWPALLAWSGSDLSALRDRALERSRVSTEIGLPGSIAKTQAERWNGNATLTATLQLARALTDAGQRGEAMALLRRLLSKAPQDASGNQTREFLTIRLASMVFENGDPAAAIAMLEAESDSAIRTADEKNNIDINMAALLVRSGSYQRGLILLNSVWKQFTANEPDGVSINVPDSELQFAWIRACALGGMGRHAQAQAILKAMIETVPAELPGQLSNSASARISFFNCTHDGVGLAGEMAALLADAAPASDVFAMLQPSNPGYAPDRTTLAEALRQPALIKAMASRGRLLEPQFTAAVSHWRIS